MKIVFKKLGISALFLCFLLIAFIGCGEKGPPVPPVIKGEVLSPVTELKLALVEQTITLTWQHAVDPVNAVKEPEAFEIFMAQKGPNDCETCPFEFKRQAMIDMPHMFYRVTLEKGYTYYFRVQAVDEDNMKSEYSKTVQVEL